MINEAIIYACQQHDGQYDKDGIPSIAHSIAVMNKVRDLGVSDDNVLCVAILHDVIEDCDASIEQIYETFGSTICYAVIAISRDKASESYPKYIERCSQNPIARQVKLADLEVNIARCLASNNYPTLLERYQKAMKVLTAQVRSQMLFID